MIFELNVEMNLLVNALNELQFFIIIFNAPDQIFDNLNNS